MKIGFIGAGNMAASIIKGIITAGTVSDENIIAYDAFKERLEQLSAENGFKAAPSNERVIEESDIVFLAVKPNVIEPVLKPLAELITKRQPVIVSIAAGTPMSSISGFLKNEEISIVRILPNMNVEIGEGVVAICRNAKVSDDQLEKVKSLLRPLGRIIPIDEEMMTTFSSLGGCGTAYTLMFIEALAKAGLKEGLPKAQAIEIAAQAVAGTAKLLLESKEHPYVLIDRACSPGGTTICGVKALEDGAFTSTVMKAVAASSARDVEIINSKKS